MRTSRQPYLISFSAVLLIILCASLAAASALIPTHYDLLLEPDIPSKSLKGSLTVTTPGSNTGGVLDLDCGDLVVDAVREGNQALKFDVTNHHLHVAIPIGTSRLRQISIEYHGAPKRGVRFYPDRMQVYTVFSTDQWMPCINDPNVRASLRMRIETATDLTTVGNGRFAGRRVRPNARVEDEWRQQRPVPSYTYGFVIGPFHTVTDHQGRTELRYVYTQYSERQVREIFRDSRDMMSFFEERSGVKYPERSYTQVLAAGGVEQEMAAFTALRERYGQGVLLNERDIWLAAHEMAHQWWGIGVGCEAWTHFWLNEGMASFMADAYKEHRFGHDEYAKEIEDSRKLYEKVLNAGKDKSLVFPDWLHPTAEDRTLVYDKGAYVLHSLRDEMGSDAFWSGLRAYTRKYFGNSVTTADFQRAMQEATPKDLTPFFNKWVYLK